MGEVLHLEVPVHDAHSVQVVHSIQHLADEGAGVLLCVKALLHDAVEQLPARYPAKKPTQLTVGGWDPRLEWSLFLAQEGRGGGREDGRKGREGGREVGMEGRKEGRMEEREEEGNERRREGGRK